MRTVETAMTLNSAPWYWSRLRTHNETRH